MLIAFANILDPDQARQNVWPDLDPNSLTLSGADPGFLDWGFKFIKGGSIC